QSLYSVYVNTQGAAPGLHPFKYEFLDTASFFLRRVFVTSWLHFLRCSMQRTPQPCVLGGCFFAVLAARIRSACERTRSSRVPVRNARSDAANASSIRPTL